MPETSNRNGTIFGREAELTRLRAALAARRSFLFYGPSGAGKTLLMTMLAGENPNLLYCAGAKTLDSCMRAFGRLLADKGNRIAKGKLNGVKALSAISRRGILRDAFTLNPYTLVLDHVGFSSQGFVAGLCDIVSPSATRVVAIARSAHMEELGYLRKLFPFLSENVPLNNFSPAVAQSFATWAIAQAELSVANVADFQERLVSASAGNPGAILTMIQMARQPRYRLGERRILFTPLYLDFKLRSEMPA